MFAHSANLSPRIPFSQQLFLGLQYLEDNVHALERGVSEGQPLGGTSSLPAPLRCSSLVSGQPWVPLSSAPPLVCCVSQLLHPGAINPS